LEDRRLLSVSEDFSASTFYAESSVTSSATTVAGEQAGAASVEGAASVANRWIVRFSADLDAAERAALVASQNAVVVTDLPLINGAVVEVEASGGAAAACEASWSATSGIVYAEPDSVVQTMSTTPNDALFSSLWGMNSTTDVDIDAPEAWDLSTGSSSVVVADIDTGIDYTHPDLAANMWTNPGEVAGDGIDNDGNGYVDDVYGIDAYNGDSAPMDDNGHGTHTAGTIGAVGNNGVGVVGVNWNVKIMALKFLGSDGKGPLSGAVTCLQYLTRMKTDYGVNIVASSNSWGGAEGSQALYDAIAASNAAGVMFVAAAGNDSRNIDRIASYPAAYDLPGIISVAAITSGNERADFSNYGVTTVDLAAPGVSVLSTVPGNTYGAKSGTSMATPHVAGAVALAAAYAGDLSLAEVKAAILDSVDPVPDLAAYSVSGGRLNLKGMLEKLGMAVTTSDPAEDAVLESRPVDFTLHFSDAYDPATVDASDLKVNGIAAGSVTQSDATTLVFHYSSSPVTEQGEQTMSMAAGAMERTSDRDPIGQWIATFRYDAVRLAVTSTSPAEGTVLVRPLAAVRLDFNEPIDATSVDIADLTLSQGTVSAVTVVDGNTVEYTLADVANEGVFTFTLAAGALRDQYGNLGLAYSGSLVIDYEIEALPALEAASTAWSLVYEQAVSREITLVGDIDSFALTLDAGQTVSVAVEPGAGLQPVLTLAAAGGVAAGPTTAASAGQAAVLQTVSITTTGTCTITVEGAAGTTGTYRLKVVVNAAVEAEQFDGATNDSLASAEDLSAGFLELSGTTSRAALSGSLGLPQQPTITFSGLGTQSNIDVNSIMDGSVAPRGCGSVIGFVYWDDLTASLEVDLGQSVSIQGLRLQADADGVYRLEYWDSAKGAWSLMWDVPSCSAQVWAGMICRPDYGYTETARFHSLGSVVTTSKLRISAVSGTKHFAVSELELQLAPDYYRVSLDAGESLSLAMDTTDGSYGLLELLNASGTVVASGVAASNAEQVIDDFVASTAGTYYARLSGLGDYTLVVTRNASIEIESNDATAAVGPSPGGSGTLLGEVSIAAGADLARPVSLGLETYRLDGDQHSLAVGMASGGDTLWMNQFTVVGDADCIDSIAVSFGNGLPAGRAAQVLLYEDPNDDGDPHDAVLLAVADTTVAGAWTGSPVTVPITPTRVSGSFFVAALVRDYQPGEHPLYLDIEPPLLRRSWVVCAQANQLDVETLSNNPAGPGNPIVGWPIGNYAIRANATAYGDSDRILVAAAAGDVLRLATHTPGDSWSSTTQNTLDPVLELYDPSGTLVARDDNSAADGKNAVLEYAVTSAGLYVIRVSGASASHGAYLLDVEHTLAANAISGRVFRDLDADGLHDGGEPALAGWTVQLDLDNNGSVDRTATTADDGAYVFSNVPAGTHAISEVLSTGWVRTCPAATSSYSVTVASGQSIAGRDFGNRPNNRAPVLDASLPMLFTTINECDIDNQGTLVSALIASWGGNRITDADSNALEGIAVIAANDYYGTWQYRYADGAWTDIGAVSMASALLLPSDTSTRIRLVPGDAAGEIHTAITFRAWDQTVGTAGARADTTTSGGNTPFSADVDTAQIMVYSTIHGQVFEDLDADGVRDSGERVLSGWTVQLDKDSNGTIDYTTTTDSNGYYTFTSLSSGTYVLSQVLQTGWRQVYPASNGTYTFSYSPYLNLTAKNFGNLYSGGNHRPVLDNSGLMSLDSIRENETDNQGTLVSDILASAGGNRITDVDSGAKEGIAVVAVDNSHGSWQYCLTDGVWIDFGTPSATAAVLLASDASCRIRFLPDTDWVGTVEAGITFVAWDQSVGTIGGTADTTGGGYYGPFSEASETASITVAPLVYGYVFHDPDNDGQRDAGEPGLAGWTVRLDLNSDGSIDRTTTSDSTGYYSFADVPAGTHTVSELIHSLWIETCPASGSYSITVLAGRSVGDVNFGNRYNHALQFPVAECDSYTMLRGGVLSVAASGVLANDTSLGGGTLQAVLATTVIHGTLILNADGSFTYTPEAGFSGIDQFTYWADNGTLQSAQAGVVLINVQPPVLVSDINTTAASGNPTNMATLGGLAIFAATDPEHGTELWRSDGTPTGTYLLADIYTGSSSSSPASLVVMDGLAYFAATNAANGRELWCTDGSAAGTVLVADTWAGTYSVSPTLLTVVGNTLFFSANTSNGTELWKSDGTAAGTTLVKDIYSGTSSSSPASLTNVNGALYFTATNGTNGVELWTSDGTSTGTVMVKDIYSGSTASSPTSLSAAGALLYFAANNGTNGSELWRSDGTEAGTYMLADINPGSASSTPASFRLLNGNLYFAATSATTGRELWTTDGTSATLVADVYSGTSSSNPTGLLAFNGQLYFAATTSSYGTELWSSDGTAAGTVLVLDVCSGASSSSPSNLTAVGSHLYFAAADGTHGAELWKSDGTATGTRLAGDLASGSTSSQPTQLVALGDALVFAATDATCGTELYCCPSDAAPRRIYDIYRGDSGISSSYAVAVGNLLFFAANDGVHGSELWVTDSSTGETRLVLDIGSGSSSSSPNLLVNIGGTLFFTAYEPTHGQELWKSDGTAEGTVMVKDINSGTTSSYLYYLIDVNGVAFFNTSTAANGSELWRSDGTADGTYIVKDICSGTNSSSPYYMTNVNGLVFFIATTPEYGYELWRSDGTETGTFLLADLVTGTNGAFPVPLASFNGMLLFRGYTATYGHELWKSDGTVAGTSLLCNISSSSDSSPDLVTVVGDYAYFRANDSTHGYELWRSDGTTEGTTLVKDVLSGSTSSSPSQLKACGSLLFFTAYDPTSGYELWVSDGTADGTHLVKDIYPGYNSVAPSDLTTVGDRLYFVADDGVHGRELWTTDGTAEGTLMVADLDTTADWAPTLLRAVGTTLYFTAEDGLHGREWWTVTVSQDNQAPVLDNSGQPALATILEDAATNAGILVADLVASAGSLDMITDADADAAEGIAVIGADNTHGTWQYKIGASGEWIRFGTPSAASARLLACDDATWIRFVPTANWNGSLDPGITFRAWDQTVGTAGGTADTTSNGGATAFSTATETASIQVESVNDPPVVAALAASPDPVTAGSTLTLTATGVDDPLDPGGSVVRVDFYRESNDTPGLQTGTGGDTLVGTDGSSGDGWSVDVSTVDLAPGSYTHYALAVDNEGETSVEGTGAAATESTVLQVRNHSLDVDGNGAADALTDGILILRYLFDRTGAWNYSDTLGTGATRTTRTVIRGAMEAISTSGLDVDGNGAADALTDGILILRYLFDPGGQWNYSDALGAGATRTTRDAIRAFLDQYNPAMAETSLLAAGGSTATCEGTDAQADANPCEPLQAIVDVSSPSTTETSPQSTADSAAVCDSPLAKVEVAADAQACDAVFKSWSEPSALDARLARVAAWIRVQANRDNPWTDDDFGEMVVAGGARRASSEVAGKPPRYSRGGGALRGGPFDSAATRELRFFGSRLADD
jgi:ELWxxDGT repeat protein